MCPFIKDTKKAKVPKNPGTFAMSNLLARYRIAIGSLPLGSACEENYNYYQQ
jgi:hypothetical protein